jgi:hypothetical protein
MKKLWILLALVPLMGCMTANMLEAERNFYQANVLMQAAKTQSPVVRIEVGDPSLPINLKSIEVFAPPADTKLPQYVQKDYVQPWLNIVGAALPWLGAWGIVKAVGDVAGGGNTTYNQAVSGGSTASVKTSGSMTMGNVSGGSTVGGMIDQTSTPTVVTQPAPIIVEQPAPIIVTP